MLYADDTICFTETETDMCNLLAAIESGGKQFGMTINKRKCKYMKFGVARGVHFSDRRRLSPLTVFRYLRCYLNDKADAGKELSKRLSECYLILKNGSLLASQRMLG